MVYSEQNQVADDGTLSKILFLNIAQQLRCSAGLVSVDADTCYDQIAHPMASMIFQAFRNLTLVIKYMLSTIQRMRFYLHTGYGDLEGYTGRDQDNEEDPIRTQGMFQGNGASPAAWLVTNIPMIRAHRRKGHGTHFIAPISGLSCLGVLFVDNTDLFHLYMRQVKTAMEAHARLQESVINWGILLLATGGTLKPAKCSFYLLSFRWKADGS